MKPPIIYKIYIIQSKYKHSVSDIFIESKYRALNCMEGGNGICKGWYVGINLPRLCVQVIRSSRVQSVHNKINKVSTRILKILQNKSKKKEV